MTVHPLRLDAPGHGAAVPLSGAGAHRVGPLEITVRRLSADGADWSVANRGDTPVAVRSVGLVLGLGRLPGPVRVLRNGWQSWSPTGVAVLGVDPEPASDPAAPNLVRQMHHPDTAPGDRFELRSELVTVIRGGGPDAEVVLVGFAGGHRHDGTLRVRTTADGSVEVRAEAYLGGAVLAAGEERELHGVEVRRGSDPTALLDEWATRTGAGAGARVGAPYQVGWCSWYHYYSDITEAALRANLALAADWPFDVFQLDDGFQAAIGDWLHTDASFSSPLDDVAGAIAAAGRRPGIWIAPFLAAPGSEVAAAHPEWIARYGDGDKPLVGMVNEHWGGGVHVLDTTRPEVLDHLERTAASLVAAGFTYLKLDFTYAAAIAGRYADPSRTPAERVRAGYEAIRRGAGDEAFVLGCGCPLGTAVGVVDGMRIGPDVAPWWAPRPHQSRWGAHVGGEPATENAWRSTLVRSFLHRRWWLNDPDCLMLRSTHTDLGPDAATAWARAVAVSGGMALVSDDLALLGPDARRLLDEVVTVGREVDAGVRAGAAVRCPDVLERATPTELVAGDVRLRARVGPGDAASAEIVRGA